MDDAQQLFLNSLEKYSESRIFTEETAPAKLRSAHDTKPGVWGKLVVLDGALDYVVPGPPLRRWRITPETFGVIEPTAPHYVDLFGPVRFKVEFYRAKAAADQV